MSKNDVLIQIEEIRRQLWLGHATLMVGSGFSLNADRATPTTPLPPTWEKLSRALSEKLYSSYEESTIQTFATSKNALQLAQEFEEAFQRPAVNQIIKDLIQDDNLLPSNLHVSMLELPWVDIFTTNYDTLLERASRLVVDKKYDVVLNCKDLPYSEQPRIIKLHGSFPSEATHLIISEEDYRTYPDLYSPFVNTVQQAVMETTFCLIGFSGTDPNFLRWVGWVKDHLKDSMPPIYLIGLLNIPATERKVLESKRIIPVDLSELLEITTNDHKKALERLVSILKVSPTYVDWTPQYSSDFFSPKPDQQQEDTKKIIAEWKKERESYPNWIVVPWHKRATLVAATQHWTNSLNYLKELPSPWDIHGLFELNWRMTKCLMPIWNNLIADYEEIIHRYDPYNLSGASDKYVQNNQLKAIWMDLCFSLLQWSREELDEKHWTHYNDILSKIVESDIMARNRLFYERVLHAMAKLDFSPIDEINHLWDQTKHPINWKLKHASIYATLGETDKAIMLLTDALNELRPFIPKSKIKDDYYLLSIEGNILVSLCMAETSKSTKDAGYSGDEQRKKFSCRLKELAQYNCNPWEELDRFELAFTAPEKIEKSEQRVRNFDKITTTISFRNGWAPEQTKAFQVLRYFEETGIPLHLGNVNIAKKTLSGAISRMSMYSPGWAFFIFNQIGKAKGVSCELFFSQEKLYHTDTIKINSLISNYVDQLSYIILNKKQYLTKFENNFYTYSAKNLFEAISRLTVKATPENLQKVFELGMLICNSDINNKNLFFSNLGTVFFTRLWEAMSPEKIFTNLNTVLSITIPTNPQEHLFWQTPVHIDWRGFHVLPKACSSELKDTVNHLILQLDTNDIWERSNVLLYLNVCWSLGILTPQQKLQIAKNLVKHAQPGELPSDNNFYKFAYKEFLSPLKRKYNVVDGLRLYYCNFNFSFYPETETGISFSVGTNSDIEKMGHSLLPTCSIFQKKSKNYIDLSECECWIIFENLQSAWNKSKSVIQKKIMASNWTDRNAKDYFNNNLLWVDRILGEVIIPKISSIDRKNQITALVADIDALFHCPCAHVALTIHKKEYSQKLTHDIVSAITGTDITTFKSHSHALYMMYRFAKMKLIPTPPSQLFNALLCAIGMKSDLTFSHACGILGSILHYTRISNSERENLILFLQRLDKETSFNAQDSRFVLEDQYDYRQATAFLAAEFYKTYQSDSAIPEVLQRWYEICHSTDEFPILRNTWTKVMNDAE